MALTGDEFYVYHLIDPRSMEVFYVGKGTGNRMYQHESCTIRNREKYSRTPKEKKICEILDSGKRVKCEIVARFNLESDALDEEEYQIALIGIHNLTNMAKRGAPSASFRDDSYYAGMRYAEAMALIPDARVFSDLSLSHWITARSLHDEIDKAILRVKKKSFANGLSYSIGKKFQGAFCSIGGIHG